ncbi:hypothetical protein CRYUN_Cryun32bG0092400 [Craigia yunnanensis]
MVCALEQEQESYRFRLFHFMGMNEKTGTHAKSLSIESDNRLEEAPLNEGVAVKRLGSRPLNELPTLNRNDKGLKSRLSKDEMAVAHQNREKQLLNRNFHI